MDILRVIVLTMILTGCSFTGNTIPRALEGGAGAGIGALVGSITPVTPTGGAVIGGMAGSIFADATLPPEEKVDDFWSLLSKLIEIGGWLIGLVIIVPMVLTYLIPSPFKRKK